MGELPEVSITRNSVLKVSEGRADGGWFAVGATLGIGGRVGFEVRRVDVVIEFGIVETNGELVDKR